MIRFSNEVLPKTKVGENQILNNFHSWNFSSFYMKFWVLDGQNRAKFRWTNLFAASSFPLPKHPHTQTKPSRAVLKLPTAPPAPRACRASSPTPSRTPPRHLPCSHRHHRQAATATSRARHRSHHGRHRKLTAAPSPLAIPLPSQAPERVLLVALVLPGLTRSPSIAGRPPPPLTTAVAPCFCGDPLSGRPQPRPNPPMGSSRPPRAHPPLHRRRWAPPSPESSSLWASSVSISAQGPPAAIE